MPSEFVAIIDEAGCSGDKFGLGSSEFLAMGAVIVRRCNLPNTLEVFNEARVERGLPDKRFRKFSKTHDKDNFVISRLLGRKPIRIVLVAFHKPSLANTHIRKNHGNEYNYLTKFTLERISWAVRDGDTTGGDHLVDIVFSQQDMYPMEALQDYIARLRGGVGRYNTRTNWEHIGEISERQHQDEADTHLADIIASGFHRAIEPKEHGITDERFLYNVLPRLYRGRENKPHGLKLWPDEAIEPAKRLGRLRFLDGL